MDAGVIEQKSTSKADEMDVVDSNATQPVRRGYGLRFQTHF